MGGFDSYLDLLGSGTLLFISAEYIYILDEFDIVPAVSDGVFVDELRRDVKRKKIT